jgi:hypothetical protein
MTRTAFFAAALALCGAAWAQSPQHAEVMQKAAFVKRLIEAAQPATAADAGAAALHARALEHLKRGEHGEADTRLNEAIRSLQLARRPPHPAGRYAALSSSVETMRDTYARFAGTKRDLHGTLIFEVNQSLARARELQGADPNEALRVLALAEQAMTHALTEVLGTLTVSYAPSFSGTQEEFRFEQARHRGYASLIPAALNELKPGPAALTLVQRHADSGEALAERAERLAAEGDWRAALESVRDATLSVQRALGAAGLGLPEESSR